MPDLYATIGEVDQSVQERLADILEMRAADPRQREMLESYLSEIVFPTDAQILEIGCGTGGVTRTLAQWPGISEVVGVDPSPARPKRDGEATPSNGLVSLRLPASWGEGPHKVE